jgi:thiol-disulfide isomerase/thioredoxin
MLCLTLLLTLLSSWSSAAGMLQAFEPNSMQNIMEKHKGKPFVLFIWSLDCVYCQASLDTLSQAKHENKALTIVTLSTDPVDDPQASALMQKRLTALQMTQDAWAFGSASPEKLKYALDPKWYGEKPRSYWFNAQGERIAHSGVLTAAMIDKLYSKTSK